MANWKTVSGVRFKCLTVGDLEESEIDKEETNLDDHYLFGEGDDKSDHSFPVVGADGCLNSQNVLSAWQFRRHAPVSQSEMRDLLEPLNQQFDDPPINFDDTESMTKSAIEKHVSIAKTDSKRQVAIGVAMEPNTVDHVGDFERPATIERLSEGYMERLATGDSQSGVMHAAFPDSETISHVENRILQRQETIGDTMYPAGTWVVGKKVHDDAIWGLVEDGTLSGFSIGGYVTREETYDAPPADVRVDDVVKDRLEDSTVTEIQDGHIREISLVDSPAVPTARIQVAKADGTVKAASELTESVEAATEYLVDERGHDESSARALAEVLNTHEADSDSRPSWLSRAKAFISGETGGESVEKVGATLSSANRDNLMQIHDASLSVLQDAGYAYGRQTLSDDPHVDFELAWSGVDVAQSSDEPAESGAEMQTDKSMSEHMDAEDYDAIADRIAAKMSEEDSDESEKSDADDDEQSDGLEKTVEQLADNQETIVEQLEAMANAQGVSQQKARSPDADSDETWGKSSPFAPTGGGD